MICSTRSRSRGTPRRALAAASLLWLFSSAACLPASGQELSLGPLSVISADSADVPHAEVHLSVDPTRAGHMIAAAGVYPDSAPHRVDVFETWDGGDSWTRSPLPIPDEVASRSYIDPWTAFSPSGNAFVAVLAFVRGEGRGLATWLFRSDDSGTWRFLTVANGPDGGPYDQPKILAPDDESVYVSVQRWGAPTPRGNGTDVIELIEVDADSGTFSIRAMDRSNVRKNSMNLVPAAGGSFVSGYYGWMIHGGSDRLGLLWTFTDAEPDAINLATTRNGMGMGWLGSNPMSGDSAVYLVFPSQAWELSVSRSDDLGERWTPPVAVASLPEGEFALAGIAVDGAGRVAVMWTRLLRRTEATECYQSYVAASRDRGASFSEPQALMHPVTCLDVPGPEVMDPMAGGFQNTNQSRGRGGEYFGLVGLDDGFYATWADAWKGRLQILGRRLEFKP